MSLENRGNGNMAEANKGRDAASQYGEHTPTGAQNTPSHTSVESTGGLRIGVDAGSAVNKFQISAESNIRVPENGEQENKLHPAQELAVEMNYARGFFDTVLTRSKEKLPLLMQKENDRRSKENASLQPREKNLLEISEKDVRKKYMYGLYDAYAALKSDEKGVDLYPGSDLSSPKSNVERFKDQWGDMSDDLLATVGDITKELDEEREETLAHPETIEPYDVHLAERRAKRFRTMLPKEFRNHFTDESGITPDSLPKKIAQKASTLALGAASAYSVDVAALGTGSGGVALTDYAANHLDAVRNLNGWWIVAADAVSYYSLFKGIVQNIKANVRLKREIGVSTNYGFAAGDAVAELKGANEKESDELAAKGQIAGELLKEVPWWISLGTAAAAGVLTPREVGIFVFWANEGGAAYSVAEAKAIHMFLDKRRGYYNRRHPFVPEQSNKEVETKPDYEASEILEVIADMARARAAHSRNER